MTSLKVFSIQKIDNGVKVLNHLKIINLIPRVNLKHRMKLWKSLLTWDEDYGVRSNFYIFYPFKFYELATHWKECYHYRSLLVIVLYDHLTFLIIATIASQKAMLRWLIIHLIVFSTLAWTSNLVRSNFL